MKELNSRTKNILVILIKIGIKGKSYKSSSFFLVSNDSILDVTGITISGY